MKFIRYALLALFVFCFANSVSAQPQLEIPNTAIQQILTGELQKINSQVQQRHIAWSYQQPVFYAQVFQKPSQDARKLEMLVRVYANYPQATQLLGAAENIQLKMFDYVAPQNGYQIDRNVVGLSAKLGSIVNFVQGNNGNQPIYIDIHMTRNKIQVDSLNTHMANGGCYLQVDHNLVGNVLQLNVVDPRVHYEHYIRVTHPRVGSHIFVQDENRYGGTYTQGFKYYGPEKKK